MSKKEQVVYEYHILDDLSFNEIGEELGTTRQAAYDLFKNADKRLREIDEKLKLSTRFHDIEKSTEEIVKLAKKEDTAINRKIINLSNKIIKKVKEGGKN